VLENLWQHVKADEPEEAVVLRDVLNFFAAVDPLPELTAPVPAPLPHGRHVPAPSSSSAAPSTQTALTPATGPETVPPAPPAAPPAAAPPGTSKHLDTVRFKRSMSPTAQLFGMVNEQAGDADADVEAWLDADSDTGMGDEEGGA